MEPIVSYNLYGEQADLPDVVHCETIEARSALLDWELTPHRHGRLHQILMIESGGGAARLDNLTCPLGPGSLVNVPTGCVHAYSFQPGTVGWVVTVASELLDEGLAPGEGLSPLLSRPGHLTATPDLHDAVRRIFEEYEGRAFARAHILRARIALLAGLVARALSGAAGADAAAPDPALKRRFEALVETHYAEHLPVADYARRLSVTPTHLSRVMRQTTGRPASRVIEDRIIREARRNLAYSNLTVSQIAYALGYQDPAHFSRVFSRVTGLSPRAFRKQLDARP